MLYVGVALIASSPMLFQPSLNSDTLAFVHKGDIFSATKSTAWEVVQLTKTPGAESFPRVSPSGRMVAFLDPAGAVRVVALDGERQSKRLTFGPRALTVLGWKDSETIAYASEEASPLPESYGLSFVNSNGGQPSHTGVQEIGYACFLRNGSEMIFSRSLPSTGSQSLFQGGDANQMILMDMVSGKVTTPFPSRYSRMFPHRIKNDFYFVGTEGQRCLNLWRIRDKRVTRMTNFTIDGVRSLTGDESSLVFEQGGSLHSFDPKTGLFQQIPIRLTSEAAPTKVSRNITEWITEVTASKKGTVAFVSRGKAYAIVGQEIRRLTNFEESDESKIVFSSQGDVAAFSVEAPSGRWLCLWNFATGQTLKVTPLERDPIWLGWSPDGSAIFFAFDREAVFATNTAGKIVEVGKLPRWTSSFSVSHDGRYVAVTNAVDSKRTRLIVFDRFTSLVHYPSDGRYEDLACAFDQSRPVLYLLSRRQGRPTFGDALPDLNLKGGTVLIEIPTLPNSMSQPKSGKWIDLGDLAPTSISAASNGVWLHDESGNFRWNPDERTVSKVTVPGVLDPWGTSAVEQAGPKVTTYSFDSEKGWQRLNEVFVKGQTEFDPRAEWRTIFWAAHRFHTEQFYDRTFGGVDWKGVGNHYANYLTRITSRAELQVVLGRMTGELIGGHNGISSASDEVTTQHQVKAPHSGMVVGWDGTGNRIQYVYRGRDDLPLFGSVSNPVEGRVKVGDYILAVNGVRLNEHVGFDQVICDIGKLDLRLEIAGSSNGPIRVVDVSLPGRYLRYSDFLIRSEETVDRLSGNRLAYAHIFDTASQGGGSFVDGFFGQTQKLGFVLDARWNRGGFSNPGFINAMLEQSLFRESKRYGETLEDRPKIKGPIALLINREAVSGGDLLAHAFQSRKIGPVVGTTTSGRTIGNQWYRQLGDGTTVRTSEAINLDFRTGRSSGENSGIRPDLEVEIMPRLKFSLVDDQLESAVKIILKKLKK